MESRNVEFGVELKGANQSFCSIEISMRGSGARFLFISLSIGCILVVLENKWEIDKNAFQWDAYCPMQSPSDGREVSGRGGRINGK